MIHLATNNVISRVAVSGTALLISAISAAHGQNGVTHQQHVVVPAYERFRGDTLSQIDAGKLLLSELNCQSCHGPVLQSSLPQRQAPILTNVASRVTPEFLKQFIADPQHIKPGTAMPSLISGVDADRMADALAQFLAADGAVMPAPVVRDSIARGAGLFHSLGCAACHGDQRKPLADRPSYAMPLGNLELKYTVGSLISFLKDPHAARPSGRMPSLNLSDEEARDVSNYLLRNVDVEPNLTFEYFEGSWQQLPDFDDLTANASGPASGFDLRTASRKDGFGLRFHAFLHVVKGGEYQFWLGSDDGSRLLIDGEVVIDIDNIHPHITKEATINLSAGPHPVVVEYFESGGEQSLTVEIKGPDITRQPLAGHVSNSEEPPVERNSIKVSPDLVLRGQKLFTSHGCAACHLHENADKKADLPARVPQFANLDLSKGCLSEKRLPGVPEFALNDRQRADIVAALTSLNTNGNGTADDAFGIGEIMNTLNCYACHQRSNVGGVPREHDELFVTTIPEMGDEGRIPPRLDGIGDKLKSSWLKHVMNTGVKDRPYMATRMPKFGEKNVGRLIDLLVRADEQTHVEAVSFSEPDHRVIADARFMIGDRALSCIKCHYFGRHKATGIQSIDLVTMTTRLRRDWFHRYLLNPQAYRPGTRMPSAWPGNRSVVPKILHGSPPQQIEAIWKYLSDGPKAKIPSGLIAKSIELKPISRPIIYRNFIEGLSARSIAVGYPQQAHIGWDAEEMNLGLIWHGAFIDASMHWVGRGQGFQTPAGDHVMQLTSGQPLAVLNDADTSWPTVSSREAGFVFHGYRLNKDGQPEFRYEWNGIKATDFVEPVIGEEFASLRRTLQFNSDKEFPGLHYRVVAGDIEPHADSWMVNEAIKFTFEAAGPVIRDSHGQKELIVPITFDAVGESVFTYEMEW